MRWFVWQESFDSFSIENVFLCLHFPCFTRQGFKVLGTLASWYYHLYYFNLIFSLQICFMPIVIYGYYYYIKSSHIYLIAHCVLILLLIPFSFNISLGSSFYLSQASNDSHFWFWVFVSFIFVYYYQHWNKQLCVFSRNESFQKELWSLSFFLLVCGKSFSQGFSVIVLNQS